MASTPHNLSAASAMGAQFKTNVLAKAPGALTNLAKASIAQERQRNQSRETFAASAETLVAKGRANRSSQISNAQGMAIRENAAREQRTKQKVNTAHGMALRENVRRDTAAQKAATSRMGALQSEAIREDTARNRARTTMVNTAHSEALRENTQRKTTMQRQINFAHGEALKEANQRSKITSPGTPRVSVVSSSPSTPAPSGGSVSTEQFKPVMPKTVAGTTRNQTMRGEPVPSVHQEMQRRMGKGGETMDPVSRRPKPNFPSPHSEAQKRFADVRPKSNAPFPTHQHPQGSSNLKLGNLTAAQPKPNEFTVGSRAAKPGGIAAKGSQLEAWAISKQQATQARTASRRAGGRDKDLATAAKKAENFANQPLRNFAP